MPWEVPLCPKTGAPALWILCHSVFPFLGSLALPHSAPSSCVDITLPAATWAGRSVTQAACQLLQEGLRWAHSGAPGLPSAPPHGCLLPGAPGPAEGGSSQHCPHLLGCVSLFTLQEGRRPRLQQQRSAGQGCEGWAGPPPSPLGLPWALLRAGWAPLLRLLTPSCPRPLCGPRGHPGPRSSSK